jgi:hypothetical protein
VSSWKLVIMVRAAADVTGSGVDVQKVRVALFIVTSL